MSSSNSALGGAAGSLLGGILSGILGQNSQQWQQNALVNAFNQLNLANSNGWQYALSQLNPASAAAQQLTTAAPSMLFGTNGSNGDIDVLSQMLQGSLGGINQGQFSNFASNPQMQQLFSALQGTAGNLSNPASLLENVVANGGGSAPSQQIWNGYQGLTGNGGATPFTSSVQSQAQNVLQNGGMSPDLSKAMSTLNYIIDQGGSNSNMNQGVQTALGLLPGTSQYIQQLANGGASGMQGYLGTPGLTQTGAQGETAALQGILNNGQTSDSNYFENRGQQLASQDAVLPTLLATSMARDEASRQVQNAAESARTQALARGGGPGAVVANGTTNQALADFANQGAGTIADTVEQALQQQQGLNLQQQGQGASMGLQGGNLQAENLGINSNLLTQLENAATGRYSVGGGLLNNAQSQSTAMTGQGLSGLDSLSQLQSNNILQSLGLIPTTQNAGTNAASVYGNLGLGSGQLNLQTLLGGLSGLQGNLNQANNYTLGAASGLNSLYGTQGNILNSALSGNLNSGQLGLGQTSNFYSALSSLLGGQNNLVNSEIGMSNNGMNTLLGTGNAGMGYANNAINGIGHVFSSYGGNNPYEGSFSGMGGLGSALGSLALFGGG